MGIHLCRWDRGFVSKQGAVGAAVCASIPTGPESESGRGGNAMLRTLRRMEQEALEHLGAVSSTEELARWERAYLGRGGKLTAVLKGLGSLPDAQRPVVGKRANELKWQLQAALDEKGKEVQCRFVEGDLDISLPGRLPGAGRHHPITSTIRRMKVAFGRMGFQVFTGPDVETDAFNFELLNFSPYHPARDSHDTFHTTRPGVLLRTHTSPAQVRVMRATGAPVRAVVPGACYRLTAASAW